jgi:Holliday junction resolvase
MSGRRSREKGARTERAIAKVLQANGFVAVKISRAYQAGHDIDLSLGGHALCVEVKARADGFRELYSWLDGRDVLIVKADRQEPLVVLRLSLAADIARATPGSGPKGRVVP